MGARENSKKELVPAVAGAVRDECHHSPKVAHGLGLVLVIGIILLFISVLEASGAAVLPLGTICCRMPLRTAYPAIALDLPGLALLPLLGLAPLRSLTLACRSCSSFRP